MKVTLEKLSKRYLYDWIIRDMDYVFETHTTTGINGINGSGKSTLIKILSGYLSPSEGKVSYSNDGVEISRSEIYKHISMSAPYTDIIQEYDVEEMFQFHSKFKKLSREISTPEFLDLVNLKGTKGKQIQFYSSGMKQRLQLALALLSDTQLLLLDEPTSYLDEKNKAWFYDLLEKERQGKTVIVASNDLEDFQFCTEVITL